MSTFPDALIKNKAPVRLNPSIGMLALNTIANRLQQGKASFLYVATHQLRATWGS